MGAVIAALLLALPLPSETWFHGLYLVDEPGEFRRWGEGGEGTIVADGVTLTGAGASWVLSVPGDVGRHGTAPEPWSEAVVSWNAVVPDSTGLRVEARNGVGDDFGAWLHLGDWGDVAGEPGPRAAGTDRVDVDVFRAEQGGRFQVRFTAWGSDAAGDGIRLDRVAVCQSEREREGESITCWMVMPTRADRLDVPFRSQRTVAPELADKICSPTALAMVMEYHGVERETLDVCERVLDPVHDIYGNWPRAIQTAYSYGVPGYVTRLHVWDEAAQLLSENKPLIISIAAEEGELTGAPYPSTTGHLLVVTGIEDDVVWVNDPAALDAGSGRIAYDKEELGRAFFPRGGTTYVLLPPD